MVLAMTRPQQDSRGVWYCRSKVPSELQPVLRRIEYKRSLSTRDPEVAKERFPAAYQAMLECFALARAQLAGGDLLTAGDADQLASRWFTREHAKLLASGALDAYLVPIWSDSKDGSDAQVESFRSFHDANSPSAWAEVVAPFIADMLKAHNLR